MPWVEAAAKSNYKLFPQVASATYSSITWIYQVPEYKGCHGCVWKLVNYPCDVCPLGTYSSCMLFVSEEEKNQVSANQKQQKEPTFYVTFSVCNQPDGVVVAQSATICRN